MGWTRPDKGEPTSDVQAIMFQEYLEVNQEGTQALTAVLSGCAVTGAASMTPTVAKGAVISNGVMFAAASATVSIGTADATNPRIDLIVIDSSGTKQVRAGTANANPKPPNRTANDVVLCSVMVAANATTIPTSAIDDLRMIRDRDVTIARATTATTFNTTAAEQVYATTTLPSGLFLAGKILKLRAGGDMLINSGTPTLIWKLSYGAAAMFTSQASGTFTASATRRPWMIEAYLIASGNATQQLVGWMSMPLPGAPTGPTTGEGNIWATASPVGNPIQGAGTIDSDAGDRVFDLRATMNVSNVADEISCKFAEFSLV